MCRFLYLLNGLIDVFNHQLKQAFILLVFIAKMHFDTLVLSTVPFTENVAQSDLKYTSFGESIAGLALSKFFHSFIIDIFA